MFSRDDLNNFYLKGEGCLSFNCQNVKLKKQSNLGIFLQFVVEWLSIPYIHAQYQKILMICILFDQLCINLFYQLMNSVQVKIFIHCNQNLRKRLPDKIEPGQFVPNSFEAFAHRLFSKDLYVSESTTPLSFNNLPKVNRHRVYLRE